MHIRQTEEQARADVAHGLADWIGYFQEVAALPIAPDTADQDSLVDAMNASGIAVVGTPEMAIAQINRLIDVTSDESVAATTARPGAPNLPTRRVAGAWTFRGHRQ